MSEEGELEQGERDDLDRSPRGSARSASRGSHTCTAGPASPARSRGSAPSDVTVGSRYPFTSALSDASDSTWSAAHGTLSMLRFTFDVDAAALFACRGADAAPRLELVIGEGLTQGGLDRVADIWARGHTSLVAGQPSGGDEPSFLVLPCHDERGFAGVVYLEGDAVFRRSRLALLASLSPVVSRVLRRLDGLAEPVEDEAVETPSSHADAASLHMLLDHNEWNVSRVARVLGVTRMTVYNRLRRFAIQRRRVRKSPRRGGARQLPRHA